MLWYNAKMAATVEEPIRVREQDPQSTEIIAVIRGEKLAELPRDLYIPPEALQVFLEAFEGPLDLLLYLIKKQNLNILDIPIAEITRQYVKYVELMQELQLELAAEYLVMAATLAEIKSRMLLPRPVTADAEEEDPRSELVRRLQEYERFKQAAQNLNGLPQAGRDIFSVYASAPDMQIIKPLPKTDIGQLLHALKEVLEQAKLRTHHQVKRDVLSVRDRMSAILTQVDRQQFTDFTALFDLEEGRLGVVVTFIAILELLKQFQIEIVQAEPFALIHVKASTKQEIDSPWLLSMMNC